MYQPPAALRLTQYWPRRYTLILLSFAATFICYMDRVNISVAIIPMSAELGWDPRTQAAVLSAFFVGYLVTQVIGGRLADRFGGKIVLSGGVLSWSLFTLVTPWAAFAGLTALLAARVGMGVGEGVTFPSIYSLFGRWLPKEENSRAIGMVFSAIPLGSVFALLVTPIVVIHFGWPWAFFSFGAVGAIWWYVWQTRVQADPQRHPTIAEHERAYIAAVAATSVEAPRPPSLRTLLGHLPVWAIIVGHFCNNWGGYVLLAFMPTYITQGLGVDFASVGIFSVVPSLCSFLALNVAGWITDRMIERGRDVTKTRKMMQTIGFGGAATTLMFVGYIHDAPTAIALMSVGSILGACAASGFAVNHLDIAPRYAGVVMGLSNTAGTIPGIIGINASGWILAMTHSWTLVFQVAAGVYLFGMVFYLLFASSRRLFD